MKLPYLEAESKRQRSIISFGGINHKDGYKDGEMRRADNISSLCYPALVPSSERTEIFNREGMTDFYPFEGGYLYIKNNELFAVRKALKNQIKISEAGWKEKYTIKGYYFEGSVGYDSYNIVFNVETVLPNGKFYISFDASGEITGKAEFESRSNSKNYQYIHIYKNEVSAEFWAAANTASGGDKIYMYTSKRDYLTVDVTNSNATRTACSIKEFLTQADANLLTKGRYTVKGQEVKIIGARVNGKITYLTFDKAYTFASGDKIYPFEYMPSNSTYTSRSLIDEDFTNSITDTEDFYLYKDTFGKTSDDVVSPIKLSDGEKQIAKVNDKICIFPDKVYYDVNDFCFDYLEQSVAYSGGTFTHNSFSKGGGYFNTGDAVEFSYGNVIRSSGSISTAKGYVTSAVIKSISDQTLYFNSNTFPIKEGAENEFKSSEGVVITIKRSIPDLDVVCSGNGRLYGSKNGTIYVSKYGDPCNFQYFAGTAADSYYIETGTEEPFTGCIAYSSYVLFFRENEIVKLYGSKSEDFQIISINAEGVKKGAERSLVNLGEIIFYRGKSGVWAYTGDYPYCISNNLELFEYEGGAAGGIGDNYYLSLSDKDGNKKIWVYNLDKKIWLTESGNAERFIELDNSLCAFKGGVLERINLSSKENCKTEFEAELCPFLEGTVLKKKYNRFYITLTVSEGASITIETSVDNAPYKTVKTITRAYLKAVTFPLVINRCDSFKVRLRGKGYVKILNLVREYEEGSAY